MKRDILLKSILVLGDISLMYASLFLSLFIRNKSLIGQFVSFFYDFIILYILWIFVIFVLALYDPRFFKKLSDFIFNLVIFSVLAFFIGVTYFYFRPVFDITPKTVLLLNVLIFAVLFLVWRYAFNFSMENGSKERAIVVGFHEKVVEILPQLEKSYAILAAFCPSHVEGKIKCPTLSTRINIISEITELKNIVSEKKVTSIIFALDFYSNKEFVKEMFSALPLTLNYISADDLYESITKKVSLEYLDEVWFLEKVSKPENVFSKTVKRLFDIFISIIGLLFFVILLPFIAVAIKLDSAGHIFYSQKRVGKNGKIFTMYKFRTMVEDKNQDKETWREINKNNVTRIGKILRKTHFDEFPQAWNIFMGDLSFVGPRAEWNELAKVFEREIPFYKQRYLVKPGLFGWAQINYPASKSVDEAKEKFEYDLYYIKNRSLLLDVEIILKAVKLFMW